VGVLCQGVQCRAEGAMVGCWCWGVLAEYMYLCVYVMCVCVYVCMHVCMNVCVCVCVRMVGC